MWSIFTTCVFDKCAIICALYIQGVKWVIVILFAQLMYFADLCPGGVQLSCLPGHCDCISLTHVLSHRM